MRWSWVPLLALGCAAPAEVDGEPRIAGLIEALGDPDLEVRTLAGNELRRLGPLAEPFLRENAGHRDVEVAARCAELLGRMDPRSGDAGAALVTRVHFVDPEAGFIVIGAGRPEGAAGLRFEIRRGDRWIATARFQKYIGDTGYSSKLRITAGRIAEIRLDDEAVGF